MLVVLVVEGFGGHLPGASRLGFPRSTSEERMRDLESQVSAKKLQFVASVCATCCEAASFSLYSLYPSGSW